MTGEEGGWRDVVVLGDCEEMVTHICQMCGWKKDLERLTMAGRRASSGKETGVKGKSNNQKQTHSKSRSCVHKHSH